MSHLRPSGPPNLRAAATAGTAAVIIALSACQATGQATCTLTLTTSTHAATVQVRLTAQASPATRILTEARFGKMTVRRALVVGKNGVASTTYTLLRRGIGVRTFTVSATAITTTTGTKSTSTTTTTIAVPN